MKRLLALLLLLTLLAGCAGAQEEIDPMLSLRSSLQKGNGCSFNAVITADYGDQIHTFEVSCTAGPTGNTSFTVLAPESISGITGIIDAEAGKLTFDNTALAFSLLADGQLSPVSAPWVFIKAMLGGYIRSAGKDGSLLRCDVDDSYEDDALNLSIWLDDAGLPVRAEIGYRGRRILSLAVSNFQIL